MRQRSKFTPEEKMQWVTEIDEGKVTATELARRLKVDHTTVSEWVRNYHAIGTDAFTTTSWTRRSRLEKEEAVSDYLAGRGSLAFICKKYKISSKRTLRLWIAKYNGHEELNRTNSTGGRIMTKGRKTTRDERIKIVEDCIANNNNYNETAEKYKVSYQQVYTWVHKYQENGVEALEDRRGKRKDEDSMTELEKLKAENRLLKAEKKQLQIELDFLKKLEEIERRRY